ncbi:recombination protein U [Candidatus Malacoplasma girerdii]|uniref:Holliday junction resolvase RecU n=1 Tax=Candidatus Malacoplasma girerdii TaxID=1318617 RepID=A0A097ST98_9BACT|nr:recombination protein U [Candidatus Malacoplasma girerdii]ASJ89332.1 MAG: Holliday junction resolvase RecU [Candidatus Malacoplasma girerdii]
MQLNSNKGMFIEELINRTISYLSKINLAYIEKRNVPFKLCKKINETTFVGKLIHKSSVDYTGVYKNFHLEFESKQTNEDYFDLHLLKTHQWNFLNKMKQFSQTLNFLIIYFYKKDECYLVPIEIINEHFKATHCYRFHYQDLIKKSMKINIIYPGILNLTECLDNLSKI